MHVTRKQLASLLFIAIIISVHGLLYSSSIGQRIENTLLDQLFQLRGTQQPDTDVVIISMDEESYANLGLPMNQGWPRAIHSELLKKLAKAKAKRVIFDVLFIGPGQDGSVDADLANSLALLPTVIGADEGVSVTEYGTSIQVLTPYVPFSEAVEKVALVALPEDLGAVRTFRVPTAELRKSHSLLPLALAAANLKLDAPLPTRRDLLNIYGPAGTIQHYSYYQILEETVPFPEEKLSGKTIFVGQQLRSGVGPEQKDSFVTAYPERGRHFGVEIHATAASNLINGTWIRRGSLRIELCILSVLLAISWVICLRTQPIKAALSLAAVAGGWLLASLVLFHLYYFLPGLTAVGIFIPSVYVAKTLTSYFIARKSQAQLEHAFSRYLSPHMAREVAKNSEAVSLGGEKVFATAMFTDLEGFTSLCESMSAEEVTAMLNDYLSLIVDDVFEFEGTLIKFIGDAVFALWGAPIKNENHADSALHAALRIQERLACAPELSKYPPLRTRIGIHTGPMVVGNLGSRKRFDFTAVGDAVNIASRIEGLNKYLGTSILLTRSVIDNLKTEYDLLYMGKVRALGKIESVSLYTIFEPEKVRSCKAAWQNAIALFEARSWDGAKQAFSECKEKYSYLGKASDYYSDQASSHLVISPGIDWNGELIADGK